MDLSSLSDAQLQALRAEKVGPLARTTAAEPQPIDDIEDYIRSESKRRGLNPDMMVKLARHESSLDQNAVSPKGAIGIMQLMPNTARGLGVDPHDIRQNIHGGLDYFRQQQDEFGDTRRALAAYNAGPGAVREHGDVGVPHFTQEYVDSIAGPDLSQLSDEQLEVLRGQKLSEPLSGDTPLSGGDSEADKLTISVPEATMPKTAMKPNGKFVYTDTEDALPGPQAAWYEAQIKAGKLDPAKVRSGGYRAGSKEFPLAQVDPRDLPKPGDWYLPPEGGAPKQVPEVPMSDTERAALLQLNPIYKMSQIMLGKDVSDDPRTKAAKMGLQSGIMLGGRNEALAGLEAIPALFDGGVPKLKQKFGENLEREDYKSAKARRDFPIAYTAPAIGGAITSSVLLPEGNIPRIAASGASGFLATDGDVKHRALGAGLGVAGGEILNFGIPRLTGLVKDVVGVPRFEDLAPAYAEANKVLNRYGIKGINELTPEARAELNTQLAKGTVPGDAVVLAMQKGMPADIPLHRGNVTGLPRDQLDFDLTLRGQRGDKGAARAQELVAQQQDAIQEIPRRIAAGMTGGKVFPAEIGEGGADISRALGAARTAAKQGVDTAYDAARAEAGNAGLASHDVQDLSARMQDSVMSFDSENKNVANVFRELDKVENSADRDWDLADLFSMRARLTNLRVNGANPSEQAAASSAVNAFDDYMKEAVREEMLQGDPTAVLKWKTAIKTNADYAGMFKAGDLVDALTSQTGFGGGRRLKVDPGDASNFIFNQSALGAIGRRNLYRDLIKVRDNVPVDDWNSLRSEFFARIATAGTKGQVEGGVQQYSGTGFLKAWNDAKARDSRLVDLMFTPDEKATINQFAALSARITNPVKGGSSPSNTPVAWAAIKKFGALPWMVGRAVFVTRPLIEEIERGAGKVSAARVMKPVPRRLPPPTLPLAAPPAGYLGAIGADERQ